MHCDLEDVQSLECTKRLWNEAATVHCCSEATLRVECDQDTWEERVGLGGSAKRQLRARFSHIRVNAWHLTHYEGTESVIG